MRELQGTAKDKKTALSQNPSVKTLKFQVQSSSAHDRPSGLRAFPEVFSGTNSDVNKDITPKAKARPRTQTSRPRPQLPRPRTQLPRPRTPPSRPKSRT